MELVKREQSENSGNYGLKIGVGEFTVVGICPTMDELKKILNTDKIEKEPVYVEEKDGKDKVTIVFWVEDVKTGSKYPYRFTVINEPKVWEKSGKQVFINQTGGSATVSEDKDLQDWFTKWMDKDKKITGEKNYKKALIGEQELYAFLRNWMNGVNYFSPNTDIFLDRKKLFRGNFSELKDLVGSDMTSSVILALYVATVDKEDGPKHYQNIFKESLPGYLMKKVNLSIQQNSWDSEKATKDFKEKLVGEYGIKGSFKLDHIQDFVEADHLNATNEVIRREDATTEVTDTEY